MTTPVELGEGSISLLSRRGGVSCVPILTVEINVENAAIPVVFAQPIK